LHLSHLLGAVLRSELGRLAVDFDLRILKFLLDLLVQLLLPLLLLQAAIDLQLVHIERIEVLMQFRQLIDSESEQT